MLLGINWILHECTDPDAAPQGGTLQRIRPLRLAAQGGITLTRSIGQTVGGQP